MGVYLVGVYQVLDVYLLRLVPRESDMKRGQRLVCNMVLQFLLVDIVLRLTPTPKEQNRVTSVNT